MEEKNVIEETVSEEAVQTEEVKETESKEMKELKEQLEKAEAERVATNDKYLRMIAEYDNYRKRSTKEKESAYADAYCDAIGAILPVIDNLERALAYSEGETLTEGVKMTLKQFEDTMERLGMKAYGERGDEFDPRIHNAIMQTEDPELGENRIAAVMQKGYCKGDKIIRHAMVTVTG
ncbi:MAG: nucleotide exchange factor GrpE [Clostridia bacterium]|nr:nucleotide exchange factor GrpE [Clostridia bacterium]